MINIVVLGQSI